MVKFKFNLYQRQIIASVDGNNDGRIVFSEFSFFMRKIKRY